MSIVKLATAARRVNDQSMVEFVIEGEPASKANSRKAVVFHGKPRFIKSAKALKYKEDFGKQCPLLSPLFFCDLQIEIDIYYRTRRPDLDESLILDCMEGYVYVNDRQIKRKLIQHGLCRDRPRSIIRVGPLEGGIGSSDI